MNGKYPFVPWLARMTYSKIYVRKNKVTVTNENNIDLGKGPYILLSNHCGAYDPIIIGSVMPVYVRWVTGAYLFKTKLMNLIFNIFARCIAKQQGRSDFSTIRAMQKAIRENDIVGLFPEGTRTWDGNMMPVNYKTLAKMIRSFRTSVVFVNIEGCYAKQPRWANEYRKGQGVNVNFKSKLEKEEIEAMSLEELQLHIEKELSFSNDEWKQTHSYNFVSEKRAEGAQRLFYMCPKCGKIGTIKTKGNLIFCTECGAEATVTEKDDIVSNDFDIRTFPQWHSWEAAQLSDINGFEEEPGVLFLKGDIDNGKRFQTVSKDIKVHLIDRVIKVTTHSGEIVELPYEKITSMILNTKQTMEIVCGDLVYRLRLLPDSSSIKYQEHYLCYKNSFKEE